ncbi:MAG TPA: Holliday junction resolvase RuvX [Longimicrobiales bacterium]
MPRVIAIDFGERRIGVALSDPSRTIASPFTTLPRRRGKRPPIAELIAIMDEQDVDQVVVGLPLALSGDDTEWTTAVREFSAMLGTRSGRPVTLIDERFSSRRAERTVRSLGLRKTEREQKERVDAAAAAVILEAYLNTRGLHQPEGRNSAREGDRDAVQE